MSRSLKIRSDCLNQVKLALGRNGFSSQRALAEDAGFSLATVSNFLNGKPVDYITFEELCQRLGLDWKEVYTLDAVATAQIVGGAVPTDNRDDNSADAISYVDLDPDPLPRYPNGAVPIGSPFYLERVPFEAQIDREIRKPGALVRIKAPREMGKTSLLLRTLAAANRLGYQTVHLNIEQTDAAILSDLERFLRWICANAAIQLHLEPRLDEYWDEDLGSKISCTAYFRNYLLPEISTPLIFALDEVNQIFEHPQVAKDFLPLLRSWFEEAKIYPLWQKLRLIVVHSTEIYVPLQLNQSPFNVGLPIQLNTFDRAAVQELARRYGLDWEHGVQTEQLMDLVGGHPMLVNIALYHLSRGDLTLTQLLETAPTATGIYSYHLQTHRVVLAAHPELAVALDAVLSAAEPIALESILAYKLNSLGLIERSGDTVIPGCQLYQRAFTA
ncbi:AAA-like domain-containing protein [Chamaesiphon sp. OTE_20_metabat_361]|uniref:AAA-like domain-containing protein n=1 Tax=Chamaesiphon sp. OTE_20_metabat_361 TaxID=2964689 RepID=UPI00286B4AF4|nr:AAA-like domain-containing protein [Chamaesiphon sp. OTE_20_metabat_361]